MPRGLEELLAHDVVLHGDSGGKAPALGHAVHGRARVARTLMAWLRAGTRVGGLPSRREEVNGHADGHAVARFHERLSPSV